LNRRKTKTPGLLELEQRRVTPKVAMEGKAAQSMAAEAADGQ